MCWMYMTDSEIEVMYRQAKNPESQVQVLADLNGCRLTDMEQKLSDLGLREIKERRRRAVPPRDASWQKIDGEAAMRFYAQGLSDREVANRLGCSRYAICQWRSANRVGAQQARKPRMNVERAMELYLQGKTDEEIAAEIGASKSGIYGWRARNHLLSASAVLKQNGEPSAPRPPRIPSWARIDYDAAKALHDQLLTDEEMAERLGCSVYAVESWRKAYHLPSNKAILLQKEREAKRRERQDKAQRKPLVFRGTLGGLPLKITVEIGV